MIKKFIKKTIIILGSFITLSITSTNIQAQDSTWGVPENFRKLENPYEGVDDDERIGRMLYTRNCKFCHGSKGKGDGNQSKLLETKVADFTTYTFKNQTDGSIYYKIQTGRNEMPNFEKIITDDEDLWMIINYIKQL